MSETRLPAESPPQGPGRPPAEELLPPADGGEIKSADEALVELLKGALGQVGPAEQLQLAMDYCHSATVELVNSYGGPGSEIEPDELSQVARDLQLKGDFLQTVGQIIVSLQRLSAYEDIGRLTAEMAEEVSMREAGLEADPPDLRAEFNSQVQRRLSSARWSEQKAEIEELLLLAGNDPAIQAILNDPKQFDDSARQIIAYYYLDQSQLPRVKNSVQLSALLGLDCDSPSQMSILKRHSLKRLRRLYQEASHDSVRNRLELAEVQDRAQQLPESSRRRLKLVRQRRKAAICERLVLACNWGQIWPAKLKLALQAHLDNRQFEVLDRFYGLTQIDDMTFNMAQVAETVGIKHRETAAKIRNTALARFYDQVVSRSDELQRIINLIDSADDRPALTPRIKSELDLGRLELPPAGPADE